MAVGVVDALEEVDIRDGYSEGHIRRTLAEPLHFLQHRAAVGQLGQRVGAGLPVQLLVIDAQLALGILQVRAEENAQAGHDDEQRHAVDRLDQHALRHVYGVHGGVLERVGVQAHPEDQERHEINSLQPRRIIDIEESQNQQRQQQVLSATAPPKSVDKPRAPEQRDGRVDDQIRPRGDLVGAQQTNQRRGEHHHRHDQPIPGRPQEHPHAGQKIPAQYFPGDREGIPIVGGHLRARPGCLLIQEIQQELHGRTCLYKSRWSARSR